MKGSSKKDKEECPRLLNLIHEDREWFVQRDHHEQRSHGSSEEKKLELRLGPPVEDWTIIKDITKINSRETQEPLLSLGYFSNTSPMSHSHTTNTSGSKRVFMENSWSKTSQTPLFGSQENTIGTILSCPWSLSSKTPQSMAVMAKESSQPCCSKVVELQNAKNKTFSTPSPNTAVPNSSHKRNAATPVVGWPPIRSFRKNIASSSSSKPCPESQKVVLNKVACQKAEESCRKGLFVKINMDGVPIGRKVDLKTYDSYEKLSSAVDDLFRDLLAAQRDSSADEIEMKGREKRITCLLDGSGEYTLVYEDNEGDRILVGDVPWHIFVSTVKRLRVLKSSELPTLSVGTKQQKITLDAALK